MRLGCKGMEMTNTLAYFDTATIMAVIFYSTGPWGLYFKSFYGSNCCRIVISLDVCHPSLTLMSKAGAYQTGDT